MIRIEAIWLAADPLDMRAGADTALARVVQVFGAARPHHAYLFANKRANRMKVAGSSSDTLRSSIAPTQNTKKKNPENAKALGSPSSLEPRPGSRL